ncbi:MAG: glycosyltransferase [bacterium]|nr:glycosyltransferase [bacterium]
MPLNIAYINHSSNIGGAETNLLNIMSGINNNDFIPAIVFLPRNGPLLVEIEKRGIKVRIISYYSLKLKNPFRYLSTLTNLIVPLLKEKIDIIHLNHQYLIDHLSSVSNLINRPLICHCRGSNLASFFESKQKWFMKTDCFIAVSRSVALELYSLGIDESKVEVIYDGVDLNKFHRTKKTFVLRKEFNFSENDLIIGIIGRIEPKKGSSDIIYAAREVKKYVKNVKIVYIGESDINDRDYINELKTLARKLEVDEMFRFAGFRSNIPEVLNDLDLFVLPSWDEALPNVLLESMASGILTISTNVGGISEIIENNKTGFLVNAKDPNGLGAEIIRVLKMNLHEKEIIISSAEKVIAEKFSLNRQIVRIEGLYEKIKNNYKK